LIRGVTHGGGRAITQHARPTLQHSFPLRKDVIAMSRISTTSVATGAVAALSLVALGAPAYGASHDASKKPHLANTHLTLRATQQKVTKNDKFKATVVAKLRSHKNGLAGENVELFQHAKGATKWVDTSTGGTTDSNGAVTFSFVQTESKQQYRVVFAGDSTYQRSHSGTITIKRSKAAQSSSS
jgi:hypothetical protein